MNDTLLLLKNFIKKPKEIGAIMPSSRSLTKEITKNIDFKTSKIIIELGPGLGTFTKEIMKKAPADARIICFEVNRKFCAHLKREINDERVLIINAGAENIEAELAKIGIKTADCIISGLPFRNFSEKKREIILNQAHSSLKENGKLTLFQYTNGISELLESHFKKVRRKFVALNMPPAFVYVCKK